MAVSMAADITTKAPVKMTGAGMMDCRNALNEGAEGDFDKAMKLSVKGQAVAASVQTARLLKVAFLG